MRRSPNRSTILALGLFLMTTVAVSFWTIGHIKDAVVRAALHGGTSPVQAVMATVGPIDVALLFLVVLSVFWIVWLEITRGAFSLLLNDATVTEAFVVLTLFLVWTGHSYGFPGVLLAGDTATHISRFLEVKIGIQNGVLPAWTNYQYMGAPLLWFTGPLIYVLGGALSFVLGDPTRAAKVLLFSMHMAAGYLFYALLLRIGRGRMAALITSVCFSGCFAIQHLFFYRGVFPQSLTLVFVALLFFAADGLLRDRGRPWLNALGFSWATAGLTINHQPHALFAAAYLLIFTVAALWSGWWSPRSLPTLVIAGCLGVITSTLAVLPTIAEADWVMIEPGEQPFHLHIPTPARLLHLVLWRDTRTTWGIDYWAYLGLGLLIGLAVGLLALHRGHIRGSERSFVIPSSICLLVCFFLYNPVVRDILYLVFFTGLIAASGFDWLLKSLPVRRGMILALFALIACDVMSTSVLPVARTDKGFLIEAGQRLIDNSPNSRVIQVELEPGSQLTTDMGPDNYATSFGAPVLRLAGNHNMAATDVHNFAVTLIKQVETELRSMDHLQPETEELLAAFNTSSIICNSPIANGCPESFGVLAYDSVLGSFIHIQNATPIIFSRHLARQVVDVSLEKPMLWEPDFYVTPPATKIRRIQEQLTAWREAEQLDMPHRQAEYIAVRDLPPQIADEPTVGAWHPVLESYDTGLEKTTFHVRSDAPGYAQLSHPWYPGILVFVNGVAVKPLRGSLDFLVVKIPAGDTTIELRPELTRIEWLSLLISLVGLTATLSYTCWLARRHPTNRSQRQAIELHGRIG
jgi:hypothetical protein